jgi:thiol peroxidase
MAKLTLRGNPINTVGAIPKAGTKAPSFQLTAADLSEITEVNFAGRRVVLNIFPSIDTAVCSNSVREFNKRAADLKNAAVLCVSADLPFAAKRFCGAEGIENVQTASDFRNKAFGKDYGVRLKDSGMAGLLARSVFVLDTDGTVLHSELVAELSQEPNYDAAIAALG